MRCRSSKLLCFFGAVPLLTGCGTYVPRLQEALPDQRKESLLVGAITQSIKCDISNAVIQFVRASVASSDPYVKAFGASFLNKWGAQVALSLTVEEKSGVNPSIVGFPTKVFSIGFSGTASTDAKRNSKSNYFFNVKQLYDRGGCKAGIQPIEGAPSLLIQDDLQIKSWLFDQLPGIGLNEVSPAPDTSSVFKQNVLQQEVSFDVLTSGGVTPGWKFSDVSINQSGTFLSVSRERTSDLIVTFGPLDPNQKNNALVPEAEQAHYALQNAYATQVGLSNVFNRGSLLPF